MNQKPICSESRDFLVQDAGFQIPGLAKLGAGHPKDFEWTTLPTLEDNDEVEGVENEPFDIKNGESDITSRRIGSLRHPRLVGNRPGDWVIMDGVDSRRAMDLFPLALEARMGHPANLSFWDVYGATDTSGSSCSGGVVVGQDRNNAGRSWDGDIAEIIAYDSVVSDLDRSIITNSLGSKWGIAVTP